MMITTKEFNEVTLSPTKKDYYQIWNELMDLADKISDRWSPASTNESDPGIVLLKALTAIADKLNYNIDKNTLEAFMPSATQEESMRKLTEMMGYTMKYYRAATCDVNFSFKDTAEKSLSSFGAAGIYFPRFVNLKNTDEDINYVTLEEFTINSNEPVRRIAAAEGVLRICETENDNIISMLHIDDNQRYYFPEVTVAENCVFITNIATDSSGVNGEESADWKAVTNLNAQLLGSRVFKFGFDSRKQLPYVQFPEDISHLIKDGLRIRYISTNGISGNISAKTLGTFEVPGIWSTSEDEAVSGLTKEDFVVSNITAATNGANPESINAAYNNYKKTVGTFETLVTCRDYMNKIYQLTQSETNTTPLVSNIIVSDIRDDINKAVTLCSFDEYGICYSDHSLKNGDLSDKIEHFDLVLYPFKASSLNTKAAYENSFKYSADNNHRIKHDLNAYKTIAHNFVDPTGDDIVCIKNYLRLKARITTVKKVTTNEESAILENIYNAIYLNFNSRHLDFGEEIPYESILEVIENADPRIKDVSLDEPSIYTKLITRNGSYDVMSVAEGLLDSTKTMDKSLYNKLALRNVLAGRIAAFQYESDFETDYCERPYKNAAGTALEYESVYPTGTNYITKLESKFVVNADKEELAKNENYSEDKGLRLLENQVIQFRMPSLKTVKTYPSYVNYYLKLDTDGGNNQEPIPATFLSLRAFMDTNPKSLDSDTSPNKTDSETYWTKFFKYLAAKGTLTNSLTAFAATDLNSADKFNNKKAFYGKICTVTGNTASFIEEYSAALQDKTCYYFELKTSNIAVFNSWLQSLTINNIKLSGLYRSVGAKLNSTIGKMINANLEKFMQVNEFTASTTTYLDRYYVQQTHKHDPEATDWTADGFGKNGDFKNIQKDAEYQLGTNEYLLINYTNSNTDSSGQETKTVVNEYYGPGTIIKPNFKLTDSELYNKNHTFSKKDGFYFADQPSLTGMFTLGTDEQICIRDIIKVELDEYGTHIYWELNTDDNEKSENKLEFDEDYGLDANRRDAAGYTWGTDANPVRNAYTLKEGEHIYYTDARKSDLAYFGAGTIIVRSGGTGDLYKYSSTEECTEEDIMEYGLAASIPWKIVHLNKSGSTERKITLIENQYLTLTEGDHLKYIGGTKDFSVSLNNEWTRDTIDGATYKLAESDAEADLPKVNITGMGWRARSRLDFNMGKATTQTLHRNESIKIYMNNSNKTPITPVEIKPIEVSGKVKEVSLNSNYLCQAALNSVDVTKVNFNGVADFATTDFKIKISEKQLPTLANNSTNTLLLDNYSNGNNYYTKFSLGSLSTDEITKIKNASNLCFSLNVNLNSTGTKCGLIMFYYVDKNHGESGHNNAYIRVKNGTTLLTTKRFNTTDTATNKFVLQPGIQVLDIPKEATTIEVYADTDSNQEESYQSNIIFSKLSVVKGINPKLNYHKCAAANDYEELLKDIRETKIANTFYYNCPIDNSNAIEINEFIADETLASPYAWYDQNNVNNKFVISQIDADYLKTGITLTRVSKV
jgi:hypothetical protein